MSDDFVKRLRNLVGKYIGDADIDDELQGAANRIEKLEAVLRFYACDCKPDDGCGIEYYDGGAYCGYTAREALDAE
jgi:hypothetical protein